MNKIRKYLKENGWVFFKYVIVGASGTIIDIGGFALLLAYSPLSRIPAATISFIAAVINNYTWNKAWTFQDSVKKSLSKQFTEFFIVSVGGLLLNLFFLWFFATVFEYTLIEFGYIATKAEFPIWANSLAKLGASGMVLTYNFLANRYWTFKKKA